MQAFGTLVLRELGAFFKSWTGYVVFAATALVIGGSFAFLLLVLNGEATALPLTVLFYDTYFIWFILLVMPAIITMRTFAMEKSTGTYETLMTTPVTDGQVVLAKFSGAMLCYLAVWLPLLPGLLVTRYYSSDPMAFSMGTFASSMLGIALFGSVYISMGVFASAVTRSQIISVIVGLAIGVAFATCIFLERMLPTQNAMVGQFVAYLALSKHMRDFVQGVVDSRPVVLYLSLTVLFLFLTWKVVESRRWK